MDKNLERAIKEPRCYQAPQCDVVEFLVEDICRTSNGTTTNSNADFDDYTESGWF